MARKAFCSLFDEFERSLWQAYEYEVTWASSHLSDWIGLAMVYDAAQGDYYLSNIATEPDIFRENWSDDKEEWLDRD
jgi:hypothetical protein